MRALIETIGLTNQALSAKKLYRPIDLERLRVEREQTKLNDAYQIIEEQIEIPDLAFTNRLFLYHNEQ